MNLAISSVGVDGRSFWMVLMSPCSSSRKMFSKLLVPVLFFVPLTAVLAVTFSVIGLAGWVFVLKGVWTAACMAFIGASVGLLLGITYTDWEWEIPKRMLRTSGRLMMLGVMGTFFAAAAIVVAALSSAGKVYAPDALPWGVFAAAGLATALITFVLVKVSAGKMERMEWKI
jgi:hypothetical protein